MTERKLYIGTSGWSYPDWKGVFYPEGLKTADQLRYYAERFHCVEINSSFYHMPRQTTVDKWAAKVPGGFMFCPKISKYLTHNKKLHEPEEPLERFFNVFDNIIERLGPILVQLPPSLKFNKEIASHFFSLLDTKYSEHLFALEVRHASWLEKEALALLKKYDITIVISQSGVEFPYTEEITARNIYLRFHGPEKLYASLYTDKAMKEYAEKIKKWLKQGHIVWAFFNNDYYTYGLKNAKTLRAYIENEGAE